MKLYILFKNTSDGCTYSSEDFIDIFNDETTAEYICDELNIGLDKESYECYDVKEVNVCDSLDTKEKIMEKITSIKKRDN